MKTRIVLGLVASLAALTAASADADAATKKRAAKATTTQTAAVSPGKPASSTKPAAHAAVAPKPAAPKATAPRSGAAAKVAAAKPASKKMGSRTKPAAHEPGGSSANRHASLESAPAPLEALPAPEAKTAARGTSAPKASRFLASGVPLTEVRDGRLTSIGSKKLPCGARSRWAKAQSQWQALDAWGRVTGTLTVGGSDRNETSGCNQVQFREGTGKDGLGVFVAAGSGYAPGRSAEWKPQADAVKGFEQLYTSQESAWVDGKLDRSAANDRKRTLFFELPKQPGSVEGVATQRRPTHWAVSGGRVLVVGYVGAAGAWKVAHVLSPTGKDHAYEPLAILDMNGDGLPEIVVHEEAGGVFVDRVLSFDAGTMRWENAVASPGGASR